MEIAELKDIISKGEDSRHQFKADITRSESLAKEMVAFSNSYGGIIFVGVTDSGDISGLTIEDIARLNQVVSNAATEHMKPPISPITENLSLPEGMVMAITVAEGISRPYMDKSLHVYVKSGADKRKVTAREELQRMFQQAALIHADEVPVKGLLVSDVHKSSFDDFVMTEYEEAIEDDEARARLLENMNLAKEGQLNLAGALLFARQPQFRLPIFIIKAVAFYGVDIVEQNYIDSRDIHGRLPDVFEKSMGFLLTYVRHEQGTQSFNSLGKPEIPKVVLEELLANALIHRDYFISAPIRILVFADRVEILSPGHLPNNLTIEHIKLGNSNIRNPILASFAPKILPYRGLGSGIRRALKEYPDIEFIDDKEGGLFKVVIKRKSYES